MSTTGGLEARFDRSVYSVDAVKKALYKMSRRCVAEIRTTEDEIIAVLRVASSEPAEDLLKDVLREVLDQDLRALVARETEAVRNLILAQAFSPVSLLNPESECRMGEDPLLIAASDAIKTQSQ